MSYRDRVSGIGIIVKQKERLPYGDKSRGSFVPPEKGRRAIFVPSFGTMEKEEIDYIVEVAQEKEDERLKKNEITPMKKKLGDLTQLALNTKRGERAKTIKTILKEEV